MACVFPCQQGIVVGGGLAGMSAANTLLENGAKVVLLDKSSFCGGNSTKATSGINGADTRSQKAKGIEDSKDLFTSDTLKGGAKKPEIVKVLCENSGADVEWLMDQFNLDLSLLARLGGHSAPRTHRGKERFPGMTITYALIQMVEKIAEKTDLARIITKARAYKLLTNGNGACIGLVYEKGGLEYQEHGPVILATGGFGADFTSNSLLSQYRPDLMHLPTTNGEHCTGDGIKMGEAIGAKSIDLEWVQVHPTGLVKPDDADAKIKFLAAEALRGVGGIILNKEGERFCNELGRRDYVTGEMWKNKPPFRLVLNKAASDEIIWHCKHYTGRGVMKFYESGEALAKDMGIPVSTLEATHEAHYQAAKKTEKDPDGGSWPAYPSGKSWDECSGKTGSGKKFYHNIIPGEAVATQPFYVAIITPVIHYCMGGLEIDTDSAVIGLQGKAIPGLYAAGEVAGGVHGNNRLGGNSLLDCVVFGRVSGLAAAKYILGDDLKATDLKELSGGGLTGAVEGSKLSGGSYEDSMNKTGGTKEAAKKETKTETKSAPAGEGVRPPTTHRRVLIIGGSFAGLCVARDMQYHYLVTIVDAKEFFEYTPGVLRAYVKPKHLDSLTFALQPVIEGRMGCKYIWGEVTKLDGPERTCTIKPMFSAAEEMIDFDFCVIAAGCNFGPFHKWGESLWFPTIHEKARLEGSWPQFDERFLEGRRRHILDEYSKIKALHEKKARILVVGAGFIGVEWVTELQHFFPALDLSIIDFLPQPLGPLPAGAAKYCSRYMAKVGIHEFYSMKYDAKSQEFWTKIGFPAGQRPDKEYVCIGVKASNYFMPPETLSEKGPGGGGWILMDKTLAVVTREGKVWSTDQKGNPRIFAVGDCNYGCIEEPGKKPDQWPIPPIPKISYPGEEEAVIACANVHKIEKMMYMGHQTDCCGHPQKLWNMHWPWGAGMFATSLGPHDACFVAGANWKKGSGITCTWGSLSAVQKEFIEASKVDECAFGLIGRLIWHFVHHTPVHLWGGGPKWGYHC